MLQMEDSWSIRFHTIANVSLCPSERPSNACQLCDVYLALFSSFALEVTRGLLSGGPLAVVHMVSTKIPLGLPGALRDVPRA